MDSVCNDFDLLKQRSIIDVLIGDAELGDSSSKTKMPYLSGPKLVGLLNKYGKPAVYGSGAKSRWMYMDDLLGHCIVEGTIRNLLSELFSLAHFSKHLKDMSAEAAKKEHNRITLLAIDKINGVLLFGNRELVSIGSSFQIHQIGSKVAIEAPALQIVDREYVRDIARRATSDVDDGDYDSALTKARTLLEESFCYVIELSDETPIENGDIGKLFKQVKSLYNMHAGPEVDKRINEIISGLNKIVSGVGALRSNQGDAHGVGSKRMTISDYHAQLSVNAAATVAEFVLQVASNKTRKTSR